MLDRNERQNLGIKKWVANKCRGTLCYCTGFGIILLLDKYNLL